MKRETTKSLKQATRRLEKIRAQEEAAFSELIEVMRDAKGDPEDPATYAEIAGVVGVTRARVYQLLTGKRSKTESKEPQSPESDSIEISA